MGKIKSFFKIKVVRIIMRDLKPGKHNLTYPFLVLTPTNTSGNYSLSYFMKFEMVNTFHFEGEQKRERTFSDKKLRVRISPVRHSTVRLCLSMQNKTDSTPNVQY
mgnify:CR=1 FL=1